MRRAITSTVAVLGGGLAGVCAALELAEAGWEVDLIEREPALVSQASYWCEGKIHLGFTYTKDAPELTARTMIRGAIRFRPLLERWLPAWVIDDALSGPFDYAVHRDSMVSAADVAAHFSRVTEIYAEESAAAGTRYVGDHDGPLFEPRAPARHAATYDDAEVVAAFATGERAVDSWQMAGALREAAASAPRVTVRASTIVRGVELVSAQEARVTTKSADGARSDSYAAVVNALGPQRAAVDAGAGLEPRGELIHRFKVGLNAATKAPRDIPDVTFVTGEFGDIVSFGSRAYVSWYPAGLLQTSRSVDPADAPTLDEDARGRVVSETMSGLGRLVPAVDSWAASVAGAWTVGGGYISALGTTGIDDPRSRLHERHRIGVTSHGPLHSIDSGKLTLAPYYAHEACARILAGA